MGGGRSIGAVVLVGGSVGTLVAAGISVGVVVSPGETITPVLAEVACGSRVGRGVASRRAVGPVSMLELDSTPGLGRSGASSPSALTQTQRNKRNPPSPNTSFFLLIRFFGFAMSRNQTISVHPTPTSSSIRTYVHSCKETRAFPLHDIFKVSLSPRGSINCTLPLLVFVPAARRR